MELGRRYRITLFSWLLVGTLDILAAFVDYSISTGKDPLVILKYIASGAFGTDAFNGGTGMMLLGLLFHYLFALFFTIIFFWLHRRISWFANHPVIACILYTLFIWCFMNLGVVQSSKAPHQPISAMQWDKVLKSMLILLFMISVPLTLIASRNFAFKRTSVKRN